MKGSKRSASIVLSAILSAILSACAVSPTGRDQLLLYPESQMNEMGSASFASLKQQEKANISTDQAVTAYVGCIADALLAQLPSSQSSDWEVVVFDSEQINAFALPGKKIGVYTGLIQMADNPSQLAAVVGHEIGHVLAHHSNERLSTQTMVATGMAVTAVALGDDASTEDKAILLALGLGAQAGIILPYSRTHESEADEIGLFLMAKAGFDPGQSVALWQGMAENAKGEPLEIMSTHPSNSTRIRDLQRNMVEAEGEYHRAQNAGLRPLCKKPR